MQVRGDEQRVVVQHLLEVRHEPTLVHRIAVEAAADHVVHASFGHAVERLLDHRPLAAPEQELDRRGGRELGRAPPAAPLRVEALAQAERRLGQKCVGQRLAGRPRLGGRPDVADELAGRAGDVVAALAVGLGDRQQHLAEARQPVARLGREVGAAEERLAVRCEEDGHRPAAVAGQSDDGVHVDRVEVGPLLAVDLDVDEVLVHHRGRRLVLEGLALHDVAPVAGGVADREQDRPVLGPRALERLLAPRVPVHGVLRVLEQVRARLLREAVRHPASLAAGRLPERH